MGLWNYAKTLMKRSSESYNGNILWSMPQSSSGEVVTSETAMRVAAVYTCVRILSQTIAMMPLNVYRRVGEDGREIAHDHPLQKLFRRDRPNPLQNYFEFRELLQLRLCLSGNAYAYIDMKQNGEIVGLRPLSPQYVKPLEVDGKIVYQYLGPRGSVLFGQDEIFHIKALSSDGLVGLSPIEQMMETIGGAMSLDKHGSGSFKNGARLGGILTMPGKLDPKAIEAIRTSWSKQYAGANNTGKTAILEQGMDYKPVAMSNEQAQWIDGMKLKRSEIFGIFQVPPHMGGDLERATFSNIEQQSLDFIQYTMLPWMCRWEAAIQSSLFSEAEQEEYFVKFNANVFLRGDGLARAQKLAIERQNGIINANEWRALEEYNPISGEGGDKYLIPMNMADSSKSDAEADSGSGDQPPRTPGGKQQEPASTDSNLNRAKMIRPLVRTLALRLAVKERNHFLGKEFTPELVNNFVERNAHTLTEIRDAAMKSFASMVEKQPEAEWKDSTCVPHYAEHLTRAILDEYTPEQRAEQIADAIEETINSGAFKHE